MREIFCYCPLDLENRYAWWHNPILRILIVAVVERVKKIGNGERAQVVDLGMIVLQRR